VKVTVSQFGFHDHFKASEVTALRLECLVSCSVFGLANKRTLSLPGVMTV